MAEDTTLQLTTTAERLASAAETLDRVLAKLDAQQEALNAKVDRIVAAVEEHLAENDQDDVPTKDISAAQERERFSNLEKENRDLKAQTARLARKTLPPLVSALLSKNGGELVEKLDASALEKTLQALTVEQRIAVKAEMARAGMIE